jgi:hypothetical protein
MQMECEEAGENADPFSDDLPGMNGISMKLQVVHVNSRTITGFSSGS